MLAVVAVPHREQLVMLRKHIRCTLFLENIGLIETRFQPHQVVDLARRLTGKHKAPPLDLKHMLEPGLDPPAINRDRGRSRLTAPLPRHPACGSAPGGSRS